MTNTIKTYFVAFFASLGMDVDYRRVHTLHRQCTMPTVRT